MFSRKSLSGVTEMQYIDKVIPEGELIQILRPDEGKFLLCWIDMDATEYRVEGTWKQMQDFIINEIERYGRYSFMDAVLENSKGELLKLKL